ncbi:MAG: type II secretion system protein [Planctomycetota bacterium]
MRRVGFTIIELVIVIGIVMILIGLLLPALSGSRASAEVVSLASDMQQVSLANGMYCDQNNGFYAVADDRPDFAPDDVVEDMQNQGHADARIGRWWPHALVDAGMIDAESFDSWFGEKDIYWSNTMYIDPRLMTPTTIEPWETLQTSSVSRAWATYPSDKLLFGVSFIPSASGPVLWNQFSDDGPLGPVAAVDGSTSLMHAHDLIEPDPAPFLMYGFPIQSTWEGIRGRDK